jgi:hypothetical protein
MKNKETLEETALNYSTDMLGTIYEELEKAFAKGAKWQQEQNKNLYSEEDMVKFSEWVTIMYPNQIKLLTTSDKIGFYSTKELLTKWFEQFKKK